MRRYGRFLGGVVGAVVLGAACGGQPFSHAMRPANPRAAVMSSGRTTKAERSARFSLSMHLSGGRGVADFKETGDGVIDFNTGALRFKAKFSVGANDAQLEARKVGRQLYVRTSGYPGAMDTWETIDLSKVEGSDASINSQFEPAEFLTFLDGIADDIRVVGPDHIRGHDTLHYHASVSLDRAYENSSLSSDRDALKRAQKLYSGAIPTDAWVDDNGRLRKLSMTLRLDKDLVEGTSSPTINITIEYYDFGTEIAISKPINSAEAEGRAQDRATQSDLRNALTVEKTVYTDSQSYSAETSELNSIESELDWGGKLTVVVGDAVDPGDQGVVCLSEATTAGKVYALADIAAGPFAGTYYGMDRCPTHPTVSNIASNFSAAATWSTDF